MYLQREQMDACTSEFARAETTRVAMPTSNPASRAASAKTSRWGTKYQSSVMTNSSRGLVDIRLQPSLEHQHVP